MLKKITKSSGFNDSERALAKLCSRTFLDLWSYPSLWKPEGKKGINGVGTELCDVTIVFGNSIILFSDKDIKFHSDIDATTAWKRWRKKAIDSSRRQLFGAMKWLKERPQDVYLDPECKERFPFIEADEEYEFYLVAVTRNTYEATARYFGGNSSGSLMLHSLENYPEEETPFCVRDNRKEHYVHVFDEVSMKMVLQELDTAPDFIKYLKDKEHAVRQLRYRIIPGEEAFLGTYMLQNGPLVQRPFEKIAGAASGDFDFLQVSEGEWDAYSSSGLQAHRRQLNRGSAFWDDFITLFCKAILEGYAPNPLGATANMHEIAVRSLASVSRHSRIILSETYQAKVKETPRHVRSSRIWHTENKDQLIILVLTPRRQGKTYEEYREERRQWMQSYCYAAKVRFPSKSYFTAIGTEPGIGDIRSEDVFTLHIPELSPEELESTKKLMKEENILNDTWQTKRSIYSQDTDIRKPIRNQLVTPGRNDPCGCGSGKKYKKCCLGRGYDMGAVHGLVHPR
ncbi:SEC-C metal-binding domain-containing protein [Acidovorax sp. D2M1]|uniref:SEC-C metal-binding domain-containing protein n=1 Tax=Acidovorax benzenivorans TaxID=2987520 RepID=A0ABT5RZQ7_9BURK|nr:SEC-C metal-binding domain-containing protein [Acidovorax benzenivorans]MDD2179192.1 SEC-C metal-binding domain-containing protein [Acidovorax benzenivorans]